MFLQSLLILVPVITSFLPPTHSSTYMPALFTIWRSFNSGVIDERIMERCAYLAEENLSIESGDGNAAWKDVGVWTTEEWNFLIARGSGFMSTFFQPRRT
jgi:proteasome activator subunit 4